MAKLSAELVGRTIAGKFAVEGLIGAGAMGAVYRARQVALDKTIAIKVLHGEHADDPTFAARFQREAKAASRLNHPNSMQVIDFGEEPDGLLYIAMEYLDGRSLHRVLREEGRMPAARIVDVLMQTLAALAVAHDMGVVHRDLKPDNIMVLRGTDDDGQPHDIVKVCDFGIAKITDPRAYRSAGGGDRESNAPVTTAGFLVGTPEYMSPEQGRGEKLDARSDLYSVGVILFEMLTGRVPFDAESAIGVVLKHITEAPPSIAQIAPDADPRLAAISMRAMCKGCEERYQTAREMRQDLRAALDGASASGGRGIAAGGGGLTPTPASLGASIRSETGGPPAHVVASLSASEQGFAPTIAVSALPRVAPGEDAAPKGTFVGTASSIPGLPRRRRAAMVVVVGVVAAIVGFGAVLALRGHASREVASSGRGPVGAPETTLLPELPTDSPLPPLATGSAHAGSARGGVGGAGSHPAHSGNPLNGHAAPSAVASSSMAAASGASAAGPNGPSPAAPAGPSLPSESASSASSVSPASPVASASSVPGAPAAVASAAPSAPAPAPAAADPDFDPERAFVEVGLINAQGVRERAVRGALHGVGFAICYRHALRSQGTRAVGTATLDLSIDDSGATRSAIVTGADFLPGLTRCLQNAAATAMVPRSQVDPSGGTAEVTLAFRAP